MKRILFLLLLTVSVYGQNPSRFAKIQITGNTNSGTATKVNVQEANGEVNTQTINTGFNKNFGLGSGDVVGATTLLNQYSSSPSDWIAQSYNSGQVVFYGGKQWMSKESTVAGDIPSVSDKWEDVTFESLNNSVKLTGNQTKTGNLTIANNLNLSDVYANSLNGFILKNNLPFIHNFYAGTNPITGGTGKNTFVGLNSGNFNSDNFTYASTMLGFESGMSNKNGCSNTGIGYYALRLNENGFGNTALGTFVLGNAINSNQNTSVGWHSMLYRTGGSSNTGVGVDVLKENLEGNFNTAFGANAGANNVSGNLNVFLGYAAGFNELGSSKLYISNSSTSDPLLKGDFASNSLSLGAGTGNKVDFYGVGSIAKIDYRNHANSLIPIIHDASGHTFNLNGSPSLTLNGVGAAVGLSSGNINKFEVLVASSTGGSGVNGIAVHDGQVNRMALLSGVNTASSYSWIQSIKGSVGSRPIFLNPNGGGVSIGNTTDAGTGNINIAGKATAGSPATVANDLMRKGETDTALSLKANLASPTFTGTPTAPTATLGTNNTQVANALFVNSAIATADASNVKLTGNQTKTGILTIDNPIGGGTKIVGTNSQVSTDALIELTTAANSNRAINIEHNGNGVGLRVNATSISSNQGILVNVSTTGVASPFLATKNNATVFRVSDLGQVNAESFKINALNTAPASATATGTQGEIRVTATHIYVCTATNTWVRSALTTW